MENESDKDSITKQFSSDFVNVLDRILSDYQKKNPSKVKKLCFVTTSGKTTGRLVCFQKRHDSKLLLASSTNPRLFPGMLDSSIDMKYKQVSCPPRIASKLDAVLEPTPKPKSYFDVLEKIVKPFADVQKKLEGSPGKVAGVMEKLKDAMVEGKPLEISKLILQKWKSWANNIW